MARTAQVVDVASPVFLPSRGSKNHVNGQCRPCRDLFSAAGCSSGQHCNFCHCEHSTEELAQMAFTDQMKADKRTKKTQMCPVNLSQPMPPPGLREDVGATGTRNMTTSSLLAERRGLACLSTVRTRTAPVSRMNFCSPFGGECCSPLTAPVVSMSSNRMMMSPKTPNTSRSTKACCSADLPSRGSKNHTNGRCRPCRDLISPNGCDHGELCNFCHFDHDEAKFREIAMIDEERRVKKLNSITASTTPASEPTSPVRPPPGLELFSQPPSPLVNKPEAAETCSSSLLARRRGLGALSSVSKPQKGEIAKVSLHGDGTPSTPSTAALSSSPSLSIDSPRSPCTPWDAPMYVQLAW